MVHARRYFVEAMEVSPHHKKAKGLSGKVFEGYFTTNPSYGNIVRIVNSFKKLFKMEKEYIEEQLTIKQIKEQRQEKQKPIIEKLQSVYTSKS